MTGAGSDNRIYLAALLELILIIANIGTAVVPFPILRRQNEALALGYVAARIWECTFIAIGILAVLTVVTLRQETGVAAGTVAYALAAVKDWTFILGPGFVVGLGNGLLLGYPMYRSALVPRRLALLGLIGGPLNCISGVAVMFDLIDAGGTVQSIATIPEFFWELGLGLYLTIKGFRPPRSSQPGLTTERRCARPHSRPEDGLQPHLVAEPLPSGDRSVARRPHDQGIHQEGSSCGQTFHSRSPSPSPPSPSP